MSRFRRLGAGIALTLIASMSVLPVVSAQDATPAATPVSLDELELSGIKVEVAADTGSYCLVERLLGRECGSRERSGVHLRSERIDQIQLSSVHGELAQRGKILTTGDMFDIYPEIPKSRLRSHHGDGQSGAVGDASDTARRPLGSAVGCDR